MTFTARIKRTSPFWAEWTQKRLTECELYGIIFRRTPDGEYCADEVKSTLIALLSEGHPDILLEVIVTSYPEAP